MSFMSWTKATTQERALRNGDIREQAPGGYISRDGKAVLSSWRAGCSGRQSADHGDVGDPVKDIIQVAKGGDFDLIVMATHGRRGLNRFFGGSITEEVMRRAHCSVLVLRAKAGEAEQARKEEEVAAAV